MPKTAAGPQISHFHLGNGMEVVVIPDRRAPVVTHMVWYRNGSADDPIGKSGIAHFLEHLMFKGTAAHAQGEFSNIVAELGGQENAFTSFDYTAYFQRVPRAHLARMMEFEADRMTGLLLADEQVGPERDVVLEERRMRTDSDPSQQLSEAMQSALFAHHPYGLPIIGWEHEIAALDREDALAYYRRFYTPENAALVVAGDVDADEVLALAQEIYGRIAARGGRPLRQRPKEPPLRAHRLVSLADPKVEQPAATKIYIVPSTRTAAPGQSEALDVLAHLLGGGPTSLMYRRMVMEEKIAVAAGAYYMGEAVDDTRFYLYALPAEGVALERLDARIDALVAEVAREGVPPSDLERARTRLVADAVYAQDNQTSMARWYGAGLAIGSSVEEIKGWPDRVEKVTMDDVKAAARLLDKRRSVTGFLLREETTANAAAADFVAAAAGKAAAE
jgi:zinc protease